MRPPTRFASDVFLRRLLIRTSTSGTASTALTSSRGGAASGTRSGAFGSPPVPSGDCSETKRSATSNKVTDRIVADPCHEVVHAWSASLHRAVQAAYDPHVRPPARPTVKRTDA